MAGSQFNLDMLYILLMRTLTRFFTGSIVYMWLMISGLRLTTTMAVKHRTSIDPWLGVWKTRFFVCALVGFLHVSRAMRVRNRTLSEFVLLKCGYFE